MKRKASRSFWQQENDRMFVTPTNNTASAATAQSTGSAGSVDYQSFLKLLVAEMKNQDPTEPMDSTQYVAQLAAFSQVEQSIQVNNKLERILQSSAVSQAESLLGRTITSADGQTTGVVSSVKLYANGIVAVLENGSEVAVFPGVTIQ
jgi:flagellar basal-body rod modification protein FlgD